MRAVDRWERFATNCDGADVESYAEMILDGLGDLSREEKLTVLSGRLALSAEVYSLSRSTRAWRVVVNIMRAMQRLDD